MSTESELDGVVREVLASLRAARNNSDVEKAHGDADDALCKLLLALGYGEVVAEYREVEKWYA